MLRPHRAPAEVDRVGLYGGTHSDKRRDPVQNRAQPVRKVGREVDVVVEHERKFALCCHHSVHVPTCDSAYPTSPHSSSQSKERVASVGELPARVRGGSEGEGEGVGGGGEEMARAIRSHTHPLADEK